MPDPSHLAPGQTAQLACEPLGITVTTEPALSGEPFDVRELTAGLGDVLLVGHDPSFSLTLHDLTGTQAAGIQAAAVLDEVADGGALFGREMVNIGEDEHSKTGEVTNIFARDDAKREMALNEGARRIPLQARYRIYRFKHEGLDCKALLS